MTGVRWYNKKIAIGDHKKRRPAGPDCDVKPGRLAGGAEELRKIISLGGEYEKIRGLF